MKNTNHGNTAQNPAHKSSHIRRWKNICRLKSPVNQHTQHKQTVNSKRQRYRKHPQQNAKAIPEIQSAASCTYGTLIAVNKEAALCFLMAGTGKQMHQGEPDVIRIHRLNLVPQLLQIQMVLLRSPSAQHSPHSIPIGPKQIAPRMPLGRL